MGRVVYNFLVYRVKREIVLVRQPRAFGLTSHPVLGLSSTHWGRPKVNTLLLVVVVVLRLLSPTSYSVQILCSYSPEPNLTYTSLSLSTLHSTKISKSYLVDPPKEHPPYRTPSTVV